VSFSLKAYGRGRKSPTARGVAVTEARSVYAKLTRRSTHGHGKYMLYINNLPLVRSFAIHSELG
jgi:hypothetical protein